MTRTLIIKASIVWLTCIAGGVIWGDIERSRQAQPIRQETRQIQDLTQLCGAGLYQQALQQCDMYERETQFRSYSLQLLYVRWVALYQLNRKNDAKQIEQEFLRRYPDSLLAADIHFIQGLEMRAKGDSRSGDRELSIIENHFSASSAFTAVKKIRAKDALH